MSMISIPSSLATNKRSVSYTHADNAFLIGVASHTSLASTGYTKVQMNKIKITTKMYIIILLRLLFLTYCLVVL